MRWRWPWTRWSSRPTTFSIRNDRAVELRLWLEPWGVEHAVPPGCRLDLVLTGKFEVPAHMPLEVTDEHIVFFAPGRSRLSLFLDGVEEDWGLSDLEVPDSGALGTQGLVHMLFDGFPEARAGGVSPAPDAEATARLEPDVARDLEKEDGEGEE